MTKWTSDALSSAHTQRELDMIPDIGNDGLMKGQMILDGMTNRLLRDRIEQLERELADARVSSDHWEVAHDESNKHEKELIKSNKALIATIAKLDDVILDLHSQLAAEKTLADRLADDLHSAYIHEMHDEAEEPASLTAHRKARGL